MLSLSIPCALIALASFPLVSGSHAVKADPTTMIPEPVRDIYIDCGKEETPWKATSTNPKKGTLAVHHPDTIGDTIILNDLISDFAPQYTCDPCDTPENCKKESGLSHGDFDWLVLKVYPSFTDYKWTCDDGAVVINCTICP